MTSLPAWRTLRMLSFSQTQLICCKRWSLDFVFPIGSQPCTCTWSCHSQWKWTGTQTGKHSNDHIWSAVWQGRGAPRFKELSQHGQARALQHRSPERKRSGERKLPTFHTPRSGTICVQPDKRWHCFEGNLGETAETARCSYGPFRELRCHLEMKLKLKLHLDNYRPMSFKLNMIIDAIELQLYTSLNSLDQCERSKFCANIFTIDRFGSNMACLLKLMLTVFCTVVIYETRLTWLYKMYLEHCLAVWCWEIRFFQTLSTLQIEWPWPPFKVTDVWQKAWT